MAMEGEENDFYSSVVEASKGVLMESKNLIHLVTQQSSEDDIIESARKTAQCTFELLDYVNSGAADDAQASIALQYLLDSTKEVRSAVLALITAARSLYSNPFDFLSRQTLDNCLGEVVRTIKTVIQASESLRVEDQGCIEEEEESEFDVVQDTRTANRALQQLFQISKQVVVAEVFIQAAKAFLDSMNQLIIISKSLGLGLDDRLKDDSLAVINSAKLLTQAHGNQLYHKRFQDAMRQCQGIMKTFLFACSKVRDGSSTILTDQPAESAEINQPPSSTGDEVSSNGNGFPPPTPEVLPSPSEPTHRLPPIPAPTTTSATPARTTSPTRNASPTRTSSTRAPTDTQPALSHTSVAKPAPAAHSKSPSPTPSVPPPHTTPPVHTTPVQTTPVQTTPAQTTPAQTTPAQTTPAQAMPTAKGAPAPVEVPTTQAPAAVTSPVSRSHPQSPRIPSPRSRPASSPLKKSSSLRNLSNSGLFSKLDPSCEALVHDLTAILRDSLPQFKQEWDALTSTAKDDITSKLTQAVQKSLPQIPNANDTIVSPTSKSDAVGGQQHSVSGSSGEEDDEDDSDAMMELQKIIKMKNTADWGMMSLSLKSLHRRFSTRKPGPVGDMDAVNGIAITDIPKKLKDMCACVSEATVDLLDNVNASLATMQAVTTENPPPAQKRKSTLPPKDAEKYLVNAVEQMFSIIRMTLALTSKWRTDEEEKSVRKSTLPRPPSSPEEERQRAQKHLVNRILIHAVSVTQNTARKGKLLDKIVSALNSSSYSNTNYVKLKLEESLDTKIFSESTAVRALAAQLMSAINALLDEQPSDAYNFSNVLQIEAAGRSLVLTVGRLLDSLETLKYVLAVTTDVAGDTKSTVPSTGMLEGEEYDPNLWDDEGEVVITDNGVFKAGTLNAIVRRLTSDTNYDTKFLSTFITTYQSFTTPWKLLEKLLQRYNVPKGKVDEKRIQPIKLRVCVVLKYWIDNQCADFDASLIQGLKKFLVTQLLNDHADLSKQLTNLLSAKLEELSVKRKAHTVNPFSSLQVQERHSPAALFSALNESEIARQLTLIEFSLFSQIQSSEMFNQSWNRPRQHHRAPHILNMISRSNHLSFWVASLILWAPTLKERAPVLTKFIKIAQHLRELNNYNTLMGVVAGINMSAISRLKMTFGELDKATRLILDNLQALLNPSSSFKSYRQQLHNANPPCLPYLGTYLTDLTFMEDGNSDTLASKTGGKQPLINFAKRELVYNVIRELQLYQHTAYKFPVVEPIHTFLLSLPFGEEKDLYELSLLREARTA